MKRRTMLGLWGPVAALVGISAGVAFAFVALGERADGPPAAAAPAVTPSSFRAIAAAINGDADWHPDARGLDRLSEEQHRAIRAAADRNRARAVIADPASGAICVLLIPEAYWCGPEWWNGVAPSWLDTAARPAFAADFWNAFFFGADGVIEIRTRETRELLATFDGQALVCTAAGARCHEDWEPVQIDRNHFTYRLREPAD